MSEERDGKKLERLSCELCTSLANIDLWMSENHVYSKSYDDRSRELLLALGFTIGSIISEQSQPTVKESNE